MVDLWRLIGEDGRDRVANVKRPRLNRWWLYPLIVTGEYVVLTVVVFGFFADSVVYVVLPFFGVVYGLALGVGGNAMDTPTP